MMGFISYAHADFDQCQELVKRLTPAARHWGIAFWWDPKLHTGQDWNQTIVDAIAAADVFVALVSAESLYSDYITTKELPAMQRRLRQTGGLILPILLNQCFWQSQFQKAQLAPTHKGTLKPILDWNPHRNGYHTAATQAADAMQRYYNLKPARRRAFAP